jgi:murein DD-endopeptidase MepM/ murein hydrolase activator NlpD
VTLRRILAAAAGLWLAVPTFALAPRTATAAPHVARVATADPIRSKQAQIDETRKRLDEKRALLHFQEVRSRDLRRQLDETNGSIARVSADLDALDGQIGRTERGIAFERVQLAAAQATLRRHDDALRRRLVDAYERGDLGYVNVLLSATSFSDFVERWDDIRYLIAANEKTVRERRAAERRVADAERALEMQHLALDDIRNRRRQAKYQLAALATQRAQLADAAEAQRRSVSHEVAVLEELTAAQEAELERFIRARQQLEAERRAAAAAERRRAAQLAGREVPPETAEAPPGSFIWPASGPITDGFGMRLHPVTHQWRMHTGLDIGAPMGATIVASAAGRVIYSGWEGGYGNTIIIDHGGQTSTLYGHCSQLFVSEGQDVARGQAIGAVGSTGVSTGPHLHFEIRVNGVAVDPSTRLP